MTPPSDSKSNYTMGYDDEMNRYMNRRSAQTNAAYLLPHLKPGMRLLDIGCGPGTISIGLAESVTPGEFIGIDTEESQVILATGSARDKGLQNATFHVADAMDLPFPSDHFDVVHCHTVLMHIPDTQAVLKEVKRVLRSGGIIGAREYVGESSFFTPDFGCLDRVFPMYSALVSANGGHPQIGKQLKGILDELGFVGGAAYGSFESNGSADAVASFSGFLFNNLVGPAVEGQAIPMGIATEADFDQWRTAAVKWKDHPAAFAGVAFGETIARNG